MCNNCNESNPLATYNISSLSGCSDCQGNCSGGCANTDCVYYTGVSLVCSEVDNGDTLSTIIQKIDEKLCSVAGEFGVYNFYCLDDSQSITTEQQFVETISEYVCTLRADFDEFVNTTFTDYQTDIDTRFDAIESPAVTCAAAGVVNTDTLQQVLNKYCTAITDIQDSLDLSGVNWDQCITVNPDPTTVSEAFDVLIDQICDIRTTANAAASLPVFNNTTSCLASPGTTDTLVSTINKIKDRLCLSPTFDNDNLTSECLTIPSADLDLEATLQAILDKLDSLSSSTPTFDSGDFVVVATDEDSACAGVTVALSTPIDQDRFVAANNTDSSPGTLINKLVGVGCVIDDTTNAGQVTITVDESVASDGKVKADSGDASADYLINKVEADVAVSGVSLGISYDATTDKVKLSPSVDVQTLLDDLLTYLEENPSSEIAERLCAIIASCPSPCDGPTNVQAVPVETTTTSSTTTTTTTAP